MAQHALTRYIIDVSIRPIDFILDQEENCSASKRFEERQASKAAADLKPSSGAGVPRAASDRRSGRFGRRASRQQIGSNARIRRGRKTPKGKRRSEANPELLDSNQMKLHSHHGVPKTESRAQVRLARGEGDMRMKKFCLGAIFLVLCLPAASRAESTAANGLDVSVLGGVNSRENANDALGMPTFKTGYIYGFAVGYRFENLQNKALRHFRVAAEYSYQQNDISRLWLHPTPSINTVEPGQGNIAIEAIQGVTYYEFPTKTAFSPFLGFGLGAGRIVINGLASPSLIGLPGYPLYTTTDWALCISPRIGMTLSASRHIKLFGEVRFHNAPYGVTVNDNGTLVHPPVDTWNLEIGLRYNFGFLPRRKGP